MLQIVEYFFKNPSEAWNMYLELPNWNSREEVAKELMRCENNQGYLLFLEKYRHMMQPYIIDEFYNDVLFNEDTMRCLTHKYQFDGNIDVPFLKESSLGNVI